MTSKELNEGIAHICARDDLAIKGGKCIPYIGWFWREVNFDDSSYRFGIIPDVVGQTLAADDGHLMVERGFIGFMESNKWDYSYTRETTPKEWAEIRGLLEAAVLDPTPNTTRAAWNYIQQIR